MRFLLLLAVVTTGLFSLTPAHACLWDSDTLRDEAMQQASLFDLITGQFAHHGSGYYQARVARMEVITDPKADQRNDLAVAYIRLERWEEAERLLNRNLAAASNDYFTLSNLGVLEKKRGNPAVAAAWIEKALQIKPEGHLGLGDWYLKMLRYRTRLANEPTKPPQANFLDEPYGNPVVIDNGERGAGSRTLSPEEITRFEKLRRLIENDQSFADGFLALGDFLAGRGDLNLAFLCYRRAEQLGHPNPPALRKRIDKLSKSMLQLGFDPARIKYRDWSAKWRKEWNAQANHTFAGARRWLDAFQKAEGELATTLGDAATTPGMVEAQLQKLGIARFQPSAR